MVCACIELFCEAGHFTERSGFLERKADDSGTEWLAATDIGERCNVPDEVNRPQY